MKNIYEGEYLSLLVYETEKIIAEYDEAAKSRGICYGCSQ